MDSNIYEDFIESKVVNNKNKKLKEKSYKLKDRELKDLCNEMGILLDSGCHIINAFELIKNQSSPKIRRVINKIIQDIQKGNSISQSFQNTNSFSMFFISTIRAGEVTGKLEYAMNNLAKYYDNQHKSKSRIKNMLIYPAFVCISFLISVIVAITMIIPNFESIFIVNDIDIPVLTKVLINLGKFFRNNFSTIIFGLLSIVFGIFYLYKYTYTFKEILYIVALRLPIIRGIIELLVASRFCSTLRLLIESGIQITEAVEISARVIDNKYIYKKILISIDHINKGNSISYSISLSNIFPKSLISIIKIGEESGRLDRCLKSSEELYTSKLSTKIEKVIKSIEPTIIVIIGIFVGVFAIAMITPMFDLSSSF